MADINLDNKSAVVDTFGAARIVERSGTVPAATVTTKTIGMLEFQKGARLHSFVLDTDALETDTALLLKVGYEYDDTSLTSNDDAFFTALDIAQTGGGFVMWPADSASLQVTGFEAEGSGRIILTIAGADSDTAGDVTIRACLGYGG